MAHTVKPSLSIDEFRELKEDDVAHPVGRNARMWDTCTEGVSDDIEGAEDEAAVGEREGEEGSDWDWRDEVEEEKEEEEEEEENDWDRGEEEEEQEWKVKEEREEEEGSDWDWKGGEESLSFK